MANTAIRSFLQVVATEEVSPPLRVVQIKGLVILKIIKHCKEFSLALVTGQLLGLDVGSVLEVTNCFPFPVIDNRVKLAELVLRCVICGLAILSAALIGTDTQVKQIFTIQKKAKFTDMKALVFVVTANGLAAAYSLVQVLRCILGMIRGSVLFSKPLAWAIFSADQLMAYLTLAAVGAGAQSAVFAKLGQSELQWMKICNMYGKFCNRVGEGLASTVLVCLAMVVLSAISAFSLFRLYGDNKAKSTARW